MKVARVGNPGGDQKGVDVRCVVAGVFRRDPGGDRERCITAGFAKRGDFAEVGGVTGGNAGCGDHVHLLNRLLRAGEVVRRIDFALLFKGGAAEVKALPAGGATRFVDRQRLGLCVCVGMFVDARVVGPVGVDFAAVLLQFAEYRKRLQPGDGEKIQSHPHAGKPCTCAFNNGQKRFDTEVVVDQKNTGSAALNGDLKVALGLFGIEHVNHRQHCRAWRFEQLVEVVSIHCEHFFPLDFREWASIIKINIGNALICF